MGNRNTAAHTPGEWRKEGPDPFGDYNILPPAPENLAIAAVVSNLRSPEEVYANACVFTAASQLLAAAEKVLAHLNARIDQAPSNAKPVFIGIVDLHDAIAAARGRGR